jgi:pimeloyl-ACP methyl ester carboxylesterase
MVVGSMFGILIANRLSLPPSVGIGIVGRVLTVLLGLGLVTLAVVIARPASTYPIIGQDGKPLPGSVAELTQIQVGGVEQTLMIRGRDVDNPVLLYLAGGPGGTDLGAMRSDTSLEGEFVVVTWDQRGTGKSYAAIDPIEDMTLEQMLSDTIEITNYLRDRFDKEKIYLVGNSWGTILGVLAVQQHPELYHAYVGTGQMVNLRETDIMFYEETLAWAVKTGRDDLVSTLEKNGPPPYEDLLEYEPVINHEHDWNAYPEMGSSEEMPFNTFVPENSFMDRVNAMRGLLDTYATLYPQLQSIDFRSDVEGIDVPFYLVMGVHEARGRRVLADEWFELLSAPHKEYVVFDHSGHRPLFEQPADFAAFMQRVLEETYKD